MNTQSVGAEVGLDQSRARMSMAVSALGVLVVILAPMLLGTIAPLSAAAGSSGGSKPVAPLRHQPSQTPIPSSTPSPSATSTPSASAVPSSPRPTTTATTKGDAPKAQPQPTVVRKADGSVDCRKVKCVALTFDDGPGDYTDRVLAILKAANAHASFFMIGSQISSYPAQVRRVQAAGHDLGNHTWSHPHLAGMSLAAQQRQIDRTQAAFTAVGVKAPIWMRPPYGNFDTNSSRLGMAVAMWSVDTEDWLNRDSAKTTQRALSGAQPGAVILMHEIHESTIAALPGLIAALQGQGYALVSMTEMCGKVKPGTIVRTCGAAA